MEDLLKVRKLDFDKRIVMGFYYELPVQGKGKLIFRFGRKNNKCIMESFWYANGNSNLIFLGNYINESMKVVVQNLKNKLENKFDVCSIRSFEKLFSNEEIDY